MTHVDNTVPDATAPSGDGRLAGLVACGPEERLVPGEVDAVSPTLGDIHRVANARTDAPSISIHVYGGDIGSIRRHAFAGDGTARTVVAPAGDDEAYRRPYVGTSVAPEAMQAYLDWEYGLVAQLDRDGTHRFTVGPGRQPARRPVSQIPQIR